MKQEERLSYLLDYFLSENVEHQNISFPDDINGQKNILRGLMNFRPPMPLNPEILEMQDAYLQEELSSRIVPLSTLTPIKENLYLWQGDITTLAVDGIVNAANSDLIGCFHPNHGCIDNAIHTFSGVQLRLACHELMEKQGRPETTGNAKITPAFNLPSKYVLHTVGPIVRGDLELFHKDGLQKCYEACLELALKENLKSLAFCCISTGEYHFPNKVACEIAVTTVEAFQKKHKGALDVIFNVFKDEDLKLYEEKLS